MPKKHMDPTARFFLRSVLEETLSQRECPAWELPWVWSLLSENLFAKGYVRIAPFPRNLYGYL